ncbi:hypothetical protein [Thermaerobacillus caldiproteolyticus]|uniref:Uncharacterized protein n=1 Tax=Thermaerobacillus caldiproteolyticus TaxID=247480 RepID=A0A7V9Z612_9BACL|nr:hypothetical protein [Anoxybacillus caldiproteolyticus]MBA2874669.1 hypothetical protein [Anoxybacillus caldiproteolyticus]QPA31460.1 hypothetical protein ISX45_18905 [Anoxybacillus caldiproteolyticus]
MNMCFSASRLMKASEVRQICEKMRNQLTLLMTLELAAKEELYKRFGQKEKAAS